MSQVRVLIVDPDLELGENLVRRLVTRGFVAEAVATGQEGLAVVLSEPVDVILLDLLISDMDALDALDRLKDHAPALEIICLIGHSASVTGMEAIERGAYDFLYKPLDLGLLLEKITAAVEAH
ncbi:MAG: response regulator [Desulfobulbaceae bacterium]|uniref:Response regulator n=1 Tax=Candidatus Desulfatifera sulfidica TaxID=2841691 RepID=A0A8J6NAL3_9BACT|nr:response regulator [Candidatus Desulfatifera sulfidica]